MTWLIALITGLALGAAGTFIYCYFLPQLEVKKLNEQVLQEEEQAILALRKVGEEIKEENIKLTEQHKLLVERRDSIQEDLIEMEKQAKYSAEQFFNSSMELAKEQLDKSLQQTAIEYQAKEDEYVKEYLAILEDFSNQYIQHYKEYEEQTKEIDIQIKNKQLELQNIKKLVDSAVEVAKRQEEKIQEFNFYRLKLSEQDIEEIKKLRSVEPYLKDKEALNKVIWKVYYEKPYTDLIGRVIGNQIKTGIYKITNIKNQMCYVGQSVDLASRWKQHIKRGIGAEAPTRNKLYPAMLSFGVENFTFEIIEECEKTELDEKEKYWQNFYQANTFGYSIK